MPPCWCFLWDCFKFKKFISSQNLTEIFKKHDTNHFLAQSIIKREKYFRRPNSNKHAVATSSICFLVETKFGLFLILIQIQDLDSDLKTGFKSGFESRIRIRIQIQDSHPDSNPGFASRSESTRTGYFLTLRYKTEHKISHSYLKNWKYIFPRDRIF